LDGITNSESNLRFRVRSVGHLLEASVLVVTTIIHVLSGDDVAELIQELNSEMHWLIWVSAGWALGLASRSPIRKVSIRNQPNVVQFIAAIGNENLPGLDFTLASVTPLSLNFSRL
jgi:hypothetical protein